MKNNNYTYTYDDNISDLEYILLNRFISTYAKENIIVADDYEEQYEILSLNSPNYIIKKSSNIERKINIEKKQYYNNNTYIVRITLSNENILITNSNYLIIESIEIINDNMVHIINLDIKDKNKRDLLFNISNIFNTKNVIAPEDYNMNKLHESYNLKNFINGCEWNKISTIIDANPYILDDLFIIDETNSRENLYTATFSTMLYQLISYKLNNQDLLSDEDIKKLDNIIVKLSSSDLQKITINRKIKTIKDTSNCELFNNNVKRKLIKTSSLYNSSNARLNIETDELYRSLRKVKRKY